MGQGRIQGWGTFFNNAFDEYNFSMISNLFDNNNSYALYRYTEIANVRKNCIVPVFGEDLKIKNKIFKYCIICHKTCSRSTKMAIVEWKFSKIFRESEPPYPLKPFTLLIRFFPSVWAKWRSKSDPLYGLRCGIFEPEVFSRQMVEPAVPFYELRF